jgi:iron complex outermembrane recepter protein
VLWTPVHRLGGSIDPIAMQSAPSSLSRRSLAAAALSLVLLLCPVPVPAQAVNVGTIEGRVLNARSGEYLANARITVEGTRLETFTDSDGNYRLMNVPAGTARVTAFFTSLTPQTHAIPVIAGQIARHDVTLATPDTKTVDGVITLDEMVVATSREMDAAALAINEQRFAANIKDVVSTDEFGNVAEGNVAEFLKFLPGVTIDYTGGNARDISLNGVPSDNVPVTVDGFGIAAAANLGTNRAVQSDMISINNLSRIEVSFSPTPESQGSALAGSVNMVPRSSFERAKPVLNASAYLLMRDNARDFKKVPGPKPSRTRNVHPGFDFSYVAPVNKNFGFTLSAGISTNYSPQDNLLNTWRGTQSATNGNAFPHTAFDQPYLSAFQVQDAPKVTTRRSVGATVDYRLTRNNRVTFGFQYSSFDGQFIVANVNYNVGRVLPGDFSTTSTRGAPGAGTLQTSHLERNRFNRTYMPTFVWRHDGPVLKGDLGLGLSQQSDYNRDIDQGYFRNVVMQRTNVTIAFDDMFYLRPRRITVTDGTTGAPVDPFSLSSYSIVSAASQANATHDQQRTAYGSLRRDFYTNVPFTVKVGFDLRESVREIRGGNTVFNYVGPDRSPVPFFDPIYSQRVMPYGFPRLEAPSNRKIWEHYVANPNYFSENLNTTYRNKVTNSKHSEEIVSALYFRGDVSLLERRLKLVGGVRAEQTNVKAEGPLNDPTLNYQRDASGQIVRNPNGTPALIVPTSNALGVSQLTFIERGAHTKKEYLRLFPSINASYNIRDNLIARAAFYQSVGRPNFVQYSGGIQLPNTDNPPGPGNRITVNNAAIKAWQAQTVNVRLEHYFEGVGQLSIGAFRREIENFFGNTVFNATPAFLALYSLDPAAYGEYEVSTQHNVPGTVRTQGFNINYKQALTFLPPWARGVQVFANANAQRLIGDETASLAGFISRSGSWGVSLTRQKYNVRVNWNYRGRQRNNPISGASIEPGTFNYSSKRLYVDVLGEYYFWKRVGVFANLRNVGAAAEDTQIYGPSTPAHARFRQRIDYASLWTIGIKGTF